MAGRYWDGSVTVFKPTVTGLMYGFTSASSSERYSTCSMKRDLQTIATLSSSEPGDAVIPSISG